MTADLHKDDRVFLFPKTKTAPSICYQTPQATVLATPKLVHVDVLIDGESEPRRVHVDNVVRNLPNGSSRKPAPLKAKVELPQGMKSVPLW